MSAIGTYRPCSILAILLAVTLTTPASARQQQRRPYFAFHFHELSPQGLPISGGPIDIDRDGDLDLLIVDSAPGALVGQGDTSTDPVPAFLFRNEGAPNEDFRVFVDKSKKHLKNVKAILVSQIAVAIRDFNGDGIEDLYLGDSGPDNNPFPGAQSTLALGTKSKKLKDVTRKNMPRYVEWTHGAAFGDVDGDGDTDIFERNFGCCDICTPHGPQLLLNDGNAKFTEKAGALPIEIRTGDCQSIAAALVDVDLDGDLDLVDGMTKDLYESTAVLFNDGSGTFEFTDDSFLPKREPAFETTQIEPADLDNDGWPDLVLANFDINPYDAFLQILMNRGGVFVDETKKMMPRRKKIGNGLNSMSLGDLNGDGWIDIVLSNNSPEGKFGPRFLFNKRGKKLIYAKKILFDENGDDPVGRGDLVPIAADFDQDGDVDVVMLLGSVFWYLENLRPYKPFR